jgi:hypothetical protein
MLYIKLDSLIERIEDTVKESSASKKGISFHELRSELDMLG